MRWRRGLRYSGADLTYPSDNSPKGKAAVIYRCSKTKMGMIANIEIENIPSRQMQSVCDKNPALFVVCSTLFRRNPGAGSATAKCVGSSFLFPADMPERRMIFWPGLTNMLRQEVPVRVQG